MILGTPSFWEFWKSRLFLFLGGGGALIKENQIYQGKKKNKETPQKPRKQKQDIKEKKESPFIKENKKGKETKDRVCTSLEQTETEISFF